MNPLDLTFNVISIALGVIVGTLLTWIISYFMAKKFLPKIIKSLSDNSEIIKIIQQLKEKSDRHS